MNFSKFGQAIGTGLNSFKKTCVKHSPEIFAGVGISLFITSGVLAVLATPKATEELKQVEEEPAKEKAKVLIKHYGVPVVGAIAATTCVIRSVRTSTKRYVALSAAYSLTEESFKTYKEKVIETIGEKKAKDVESKVLKEQIEKDIPTGNGIVTPDVNPGPSLFYEPISKTYFWGDINQVKKKGIELSNVELNSYDNCVSVYEWLCMLGIITKIPSDECDRLMSMGWNLLTDNETVIVDYNPIKAEGLDGRACLAITYNIRPQYDHTVLYR